MSWIREKQAAEVIPPFYNCVAAINCSTTCQVVDLTSLPKSPATPGEQPNKNPIGTYVRIVAQGGDVYYTTGSNFAQLNAIANTVVFSTVNATTGAVTISGKELDYIPAGAWVDFVAVPGVTPPAARNAPAGNDSPCRYVALIASSGNPVARIHQSST